MPLPRLRSHTPDLQSDPDPASYCSQLQPCEAARHRSLIIKRDTLPDVLDITATTAESEIMGLRHKPRPLLHGVQFTPESILTTEGKRLLKNFFEL